jgi:hypothetical protein
VKETKMKKHGTAMMHAGTASAAAAAVAFEPVLETASRNSMIGHEDIARLAYSYWELRGCPHGSPEEDWFRAELELQSQSSKAAA